MKSEYCEDGDKRSHRRHVIPCGSEWIRTTLAAIQNYGSLDPHESASKRHLYQFSSFCFSLERTTPDIVRSPSEIWTHIWLIWFLGPNQVSPPDGISIGSAIFAELTNVTNSQTDRPTTLLRRYQ